jgi:Arc/MetJ-type ribon-helix-helix transcriptional regulator
MTGVKVSVSLPAEDVEFLDTYAQTQGYSSRSAVVHQAVGALRATELAAAYEDAWQSWSGSDEAADWEAVTADGLES